MEKLTIRDQLAVAALQGLLANTIYMQRFGILKSDYVDRDGVAKTYAVEAYAFADAMLEER